MAAQKAPAQFERLAQAIFPGSALLRIWALEGGISAHMTAFEVRLPDGRTQTLIMRQPGAESLVKSLDAAAQEYRILQLTRSVGLASPTPYYLDQSGDIFPTSYFVIGYVDGNPELAPADPADFIRQYAAHLASIHRVDRLTADLSFLPEARGLTENIWKLLSADQKSPHEKRILAVLETARSFSSPNDPVLLHGDYWPGNVLWRDDRLVAVIDWENAKVGDPLSDLAIARLDLTMIFGIGVMNDFTQHYESAMTTIDFTRLPYWDLYAVLRADPYLAEWATSYAPLGRPDVTETTMREGLRQFAAQAFEKLSVPGLR